MRIFSLIALALLLVGDFFYLSQQVKPLAVRTAPKDYSFSEEIRIQDERLAAMCSTAQLESMLEAGYEVLKWNDILGKTASTVVSEIILKGNSRFESHHFPEGDVIDTKHQSQYYYHIHSPHKHGHFHLFYRPSENIKPIQKGTAKTNFAHLIGLSVDENGQPIGLFTTNQWVTNENWYRIDQLEEMLDNFEIDHAYPSFATNQWIRAVIKLFRPQIVDSLYARQKLLDHKQSENPMQNILKQRSIEITSKRPISVETQIEVIYKELARRNFNRLEKTNLVSDAHLPFFDLDHSDHRPCLYLHHPFVPPYLHHPFHKGGPRSFCTGVPYQEKNPNHML